MVARNLGPYTDYPSVPIGEDLLAQIVEHRAHGRTWEAIAATIEWDLDELHRAVRHDPNYRAALKLAIREADEEADAEGLQRLRALLRDKNPKIVRDAAKIIIRHTAAKRRDETRLAVERLRAKTRIALADVERAKEERAKAEAEAAQAKAQERQMPPMTPEREALLEKYALERERYNAEHAAREKAVVYLWGGCHKIGGVRPDATDTPMMLLYDMTTEGKPMYWVVTLPLPVPDASKGPFLPPPGCRPSTCPKPPVEAN